ncbi:MAG: type III toxin-antitoxin system TenpIN family toxin [Culicoidibacterales bacterium]
MTILIEREYLKQNNAQQMTILIEREYLKQNNAQQMIKLKSPSDLSFYLGEKMNKKFKLHLLSDSFYNDFPKDSYIEILTKSQRPYMFFEIEMDNIKFAIPFRSNISHRDAFFTEQTNKRGIDYTKAVVITKDCYIDSKNVQIEQHQFDKLKMNYTTIYSQFRKYLNKYKKAANRLDVERNKKICQFSALQYFHKELGIHETK